ncbi:hypothetical protein PFICI_05985 [Pestalotiopsis fici W106-1]|uniref:Uncharacterized protein n=1 Tax=Pestalotiopsis fici (strain W106-1 / CGMCC3.15140) TaxID=1229662 RepID=W3X4B3_PESFW|nr:uncharacterized protein PFICI_05985 [Pestalotiopsis fici W106-1]ETS80983.1 hypothetical protein PFICI_05985 [Pestalotiopsis fici W106-1]
MIELQPTGEDFFHNGNTVPWAQNNIDTPTDNKPTTGLSLAMQMGEIMYNYADLPRTESVAESCISEDSNADIKPFPLMELPFEIRIQIYRWIHLGHPIKQSQLTPWYPMPVYNHYFLKVVQPGSSPPVSGADPRILHDTTTAKRPVEKEAGEVTLLSPYRPLAGLPSALLRANKQVYHETRELALTENEFIFVNWFSSGLWAARSFGKGLQPWQRASVRRVRLELLSRDLTGTYADEWRDLCELWSTGLRGLRLKILCGGGAFGSWVADGLPRRGSPTVRVRDDNDKILHWVEHGLARLKELRHLEVEIAVAEWDDTQRVRFCHDLEDALYEVRSRSSWAPVRRVGVVCVERCGKSQHGN